MQLQKIGTLIKEERMKKGMSQVELAKCLQVSVAAVSKWETGKNIPDIFNVEKIAQILDIPAHELLGIDSSGDTADGEEKTEDTADTEEKTEDTAEAEEKSEDTADGEEKSEDTAEAEGIPASKSALVPHKPASSRISSKIMWFGILCAALAGFVVGGILFWKTKISVQPKTAIVMNYHEDTVYGPACHIVLVYEGELTDDFLNRQAAVFRKEYPEYFREVDAIVLLYYQKYDIRTDMGRPADYTVLILR